MFFHLYGVVITLIGLVSFIFFSHIKPLPKEELSDDIDEIISGREEGLAHTQNLVNENSQQEGTVAQGNKEIESFEEEEKALSIASQERE